jgi:2',3'-cyclic-nucleotide 2'-phosphodiesterase (5'-nucleotidase family)
MKHLRTAVTTNSKTLLALLVFCVLTGCGGSATRASSVAATPPSADVGLAAPGEVTITLLHYNDLHAHLTPHADRVPDALAGQTASNTQVVERGGLARLATLVNGIRSETPNTVLMNIGDTYHGGVEALYTLGNAVAEAVNALGIDVGVPGNWDYAYGPLVTRLRYASLSPAERSMLAAVSGTVMTSADIKGPNYPNLAANVTYSAPFFKAGSAFLPPTWMTEKAGVKVGFVGISSDIVPRMSSTLAMGLNFLQGEANYKALIEQHAAQLRAQGARVVVVMSELGIHKDKQLADVIAPGTIDVFFSAHTHEATLTPLDSASGALVVEAGNDGYLGRMDITVAAGRANQFHWQLLTIDGNIAQDAVMKGLVEKARAPFLVANPNIKLPMPYVEMTLTQSIATVVGRSDGPLDRRQALDNTFNRVFADALRQRGGTQLALTPGFRFDSVIAGPDEMLEDNTLADGAITLEDVYRFFPVVYTLATAEVSGQHVKEIVEASLTSVYSRDAFKQSGGWAEGFSGVAMNVDVAGADGSRVKDLWLADDLRTVDNETLYTITGCTRPDDTADTLCSYGGFSRVQPLINAATGSPWTVTDIFLDMLAAGPMATAAAPRFTDVSQTPVWPQAPFVQPVW